MFCMLVSVDAGGRRVAYLIIKGVPEHKIRPEPARLHVEYRDSQFFFDNH